MRSGMRKRGRPGKKAVEGKVTVSYERGVVTRAYVTVRCPRCRRVVEEISAIPPVGVVHGSEVRCGCGARVLVPV